MSSRTNLVVLFLFSLSGMNKHLTLRMNKNKPWWYHNISRHLWISTQLGPGQSGWVGVVLRVPHLDQPLGLLGVPHPSAQPRVLRHQADLLLLRAPRRLLPQGGRDQHQHHWPVPGQLCLCQVCPQNISKKSEMSMLSQDRRYLLQLLLPGLQR